MHIYVSTSFIRGWTSTFFFRLVHVNSSCIQNVKLWIVICLGLLLCLPIINCQKGLFIPSLHRCLLSSIDECLFLYLSFLSSSQLLLTPIIFKCPPPPPHLFFCPATSHSLLATALFAQKKKKKKKKLWQYIAPCFGVYFIL